MADDLDRLLEAFPSRVGTHYTDCHLEHPQCAVAYLVRRVREAEQENADMKECIGQAVQEWEDGGGSAAIIDALWPPESRAYDREEADGE